MFGKVLVGAAALAAAVAFMPATASADGKSAFADAKCTKCHAVTAAGVDKVKEKASKGPDLSDVGAEHDAAWIAKWMNKEVDAPSVYDANKKVKHKKGFKGSEADLKAISEWLATQKTKVDYKDPAAASDDE
jgi:cytochrome c2